MNISAIVPVWNGRDLLARLLATLEAQTRPAAELLIVDNGSTDGAPDMARARGARVIAMGRNAGFAAAVNRGIREAGQPLVAILNSDVELAPDYLEKLAAVDAPFATGKILSPSGLLDGTFDLTCRGATTWRCGAGLRGRSALRSSRATSLRRRGPPCCTAPKSSAGSACSRNRSNPISKTPISGCAARSSILPAAMFPMPGRSTSGAPHWAAGIRKRCAASRAINSCSRPGTIPPATCGRSWSANCCGAAWRFVTAGDWRGRAESCRDSAVSRPPAGKICKEMPELLEQVLHSNEQFIRAISRESIGSCISCSPVGQSDT